MESFLADLPLKKKEPTGFVSFFEESEVIPEEPEETQDHESVMEEPAAVPVTPVPVESGLEIQTPDMSAAKEPPVAVEPELTESEEELDSPQTEVVFEQVEGPKVEVVSVKDEVQKIIVHLAPDKILEIDCEY